MKNTLLPSLMILSIIAGSAAANGPGENTAAIGKKVSDEKDLRRCFIV